MPSPKHPRPSAAKRFAEVEQISVVGITARMGPLALQLYAEAFLQAAQALPKPEVPFEPVRPYLVCHAIELSLKAFLSIQGSEMLHLAGGQFGHKLAPLLTSALDGGLLDLAPLNREHLEAIRRAETYYAGKVFEYPAVGEALSAYPAMPPLDTLVEAAILLTNALAKPCREAN